MSAPYTPTYPTQRAYEPYLETNFLNSYPTPFRVWLGFIDDIFMIWKYGEQQLRRFLVALNHHHSTIKFTYTMNKNEIAFLGTIVYRSPHDRLYTGIYHKPTEQRQYLHYTLLIPESRRNRSLMASLSDVEESAQKMPILKKLKKYTTH